MPNLVRLPWTILVIVRLLAFSLAIGFSLISVNVIMVMVFRSQSFSESFSTIHSFVHTSMFASLFVYLMVCGFFLNFVRSTSNYFGHGIFINYLFGKYREPVEENRMFMFIDLNGSTKISEKLGHVKYSRFLNKCFNDLSSLLLKYDAEVYQYVGDEAVLTWKLKDLKNYSCAAELFYSYQQLLLQHKEDYIDKFGIFPTFKAAIHAGLVVVTSLGTRRNELAYHGDVLNTVSRVLEYCSKMKKDLLITREVAKYLNPESLLKPKFLSNLVLRGKNDSTAIFEMTLT